MATNYPGGLDSITRPNPTDPLSNPDHTQVHDDVADSVEAIEGELGLDPAGAFSTVVARLNASDKFPANFQYSGTLAVGTGTMRWYAPANFTISQVRASVGTAPTGASVIVDVNINGTTIFTGGSGRPTIAVSTYTHVGSPVVTSITAGQYITIDIDQVGSTIAGADLVVQMLFTYAV